MKGLAVHPPTEVTQAITFPDGFVERLRKVIPAGHDLLLDSAIKRMQMHQVLSRLQACKDVRRPATVWEEHMANVERFGRKSDKLPEMSKQLCAEIKQKAEITRLYDELCGIVSRRSTP